MLAELGQNGSATLTTTVCTSGSSSTSTSGGDGYEEEVGDELVGRVAAAPHT